MCLKLDTASFLPCTVAYAARMCTSTLSGWKQHPLQSLCICSLHLKDTESFISNQNPNWGMQRAPERWRDGRMPRILLRITEGRVQLSWLVIPLSVSGLWWNLTEYMESLEILITPSLLPLPQQKPTNAFCFECLVATSLYLIPWVYNCSPACTCPKLPRAVLSSPSCRFPHGHPSHWLPLHVMMKWAFIYSLKRFTSTYSGIFFLFFLIALTAFCVSCPPLFTLGHWT